MGTSPDGVPERTVLRMVMIRDDMSVPSLDRCAEGRHSQQEKANHHGFERTSLAASVAAHSADEKVRLKTEKRYSFGTLLRNSSEKD
jgi:hypothetical protein